MVLISGKLAALRVREYASRAVRTRRGATNDHAGGQLRGVPHLNRRNGTTYYWATNVLPKVKRHHVHALYGFCRYADDIVDDLGPAPVEQRAAAAASSGTGSSPTSKRVGRSTRSSRRWSTPCGPSIWIRTASAASCDR
ncbi:MAG: squalene/phytoene synthase family protein [Ilumatobacteraceae bacterium]